MDSLKGKTHNAIRQIVHELSEYVRRVQEIEKMKEGERKEVVNLEVAIEKRIGKKEERMDGKEVVEEVMKMQELERSESMERRHVSQEKRGKKEAKVKYSSYTLEFKKRLIECINRELQKQEKPLGKIIREVAFSTKIHPKNITRWFQTEDLREKRGSRKAKFPDMEHQLKKYVDQNPQLSRKKIIKKAHQILLQSDYAPEASNFRFSKGWYQRFRDRFNLKSPKHSTKLQILSSNSLNHLTEIKIEASNISISQQQSKHETLIFSEEIVKELKMEHENEPQDNIR